MLSSTPRKILIKPYSFSKAKDLNQKETDKQNFKLQNLYQKKVYLVFAQCTSVLALFKSRPLKLLA